MADQDVRISCFEERRRKRDRLAERDREYQAWCKANGIKAKRVRLGNGVTLEVRGQGCIASRGGIQNKAQFNVAKLAMW